MADGTRAELPRDLESRWIPIAKHVVDLDSAFSTHSA